MLATRDYTTTVDDYGRELEAPAPMRCNDCGRPAFYDYADEQYHHATDRALGCFLIPPEEDAPEDWNHPLCVIPATRSLLAWADELAAAGPVCSRFRDKLAAEVDALELTETSRYNVADVAAPGWHRRPR